MRPGSGRFLTSLSLEIISVFCYAYFVSKETNMAKKRSKKNRFFRFPLILIVMLVLAGLTFGGLELTHTIHVFDKTPQTTKIVTVGKPVAPPAQTTTTPTTSQPSQSSSSTANSQPSGATDNNGSTVPSTPSNDWATSATGYITVKSPLANSTIQTGAVLAGSAEVDQISYTLIDNVVGVISQGQLNVVNGNFSGTMNFQPHGTGGRLDVYSTNAQGVEYNEVQINVSF